MSEEALALLKGAKKQHIDDELGGSTAGTAVVETAEEEVEEIQVEKMTVAQIDALVKDNELEVPENWSKMTKALKVAYLTEKYGDDSETEAEQVTEQVTEQVETPVETVEVVTKGETKSAVAAIFSGNKDEPAPEVEVVQAEAKKAVSKVSKKGQQEILDPDDISKTVKEIENLKEVEAKNLVKTLQEQTNFSYFQIGGVLSVISANQWFAPYPTFKDYVVNELGMEYRRAAYWVSIYNGVIDSGIVWEKVKSIGWTKLKEIVQVLTPDNTDHWVEIASKTNTQTLIEMVKAAKAAQHGHTEAGEEKVKVTTTMAFKVHEDQKETILAAIDKAKEDSSTDVATVALEYICGEFLAGNSKPLKQRMSEAGIDKALAALGAAFPDVDFSVAPKDSAGA